MLIRYAPVLCSVLCVFKDTKRERKGQERGLRPSSVYSSTKLCTIITALKRLILLSFHVSDKKRLKKFCSIQ